MPQFYYDLNGEQIRQHIDAQQVRSAWLSAKQRAASCRGSMYWQTVKGQDYLYREYNKDQRKSLGPRTSENEKIYADFKAGKATAEKRLKELSSSLTTHERVNAALRVGRTPNVVIGLLEEIRKAGLQDHFLVIGTNALYAYETHAGVRFLGDVTATADIDLLWDSRKRLTLLADGDEHFSKSGLIGVLQKCDPTFAIEKDDKFRAVNSRGYMIDLIRHRPQSFFHDNEEQQLIPDHPEDFWATKIPNMDWLLSSPRFKQVVVATNGGMAEMLTVDPRVFALYKVYLAQKDDRDPMKAQRDIAQARAVYNLVNERLPHLSFERVAALPGRLRNDSVFKALDPERQEGATLAEQFQALPAVGEHSGIIKAISVSEVIQHVGRGKYVVWNRAELHGAQFDVGSSVTIAKDGEVRATQTGSLDRGS